MEFSKIVQEKMEEKNLRIADLAKLTGLSWTHCADLVKGNKRWNEDTIEKFCKVLGLKPLFVPADSEQDQEGV